jgi:hypothetical protein
MLNKTISSLVISTLLVGGVGVTVAHSRPSPDILSDVPISSRALILSKEYWVVPDNDPERTLDADPTSDYPARFLDENGPVDTDNDGVIDYLDALDLNGDNDTDDNGEGAQFYGPKKKYVAFTFDGGQEAIAKQVSYLWSELGPQAKLCTGWGDTACRVWPETDQANLTAHVNLPPCSQGVVGACIEGLRVGSGTNLTSGSFNRLVDNRVNEIMRDESESGEIQNSSIVTKFQDDGTAQGNATTWNEDPVRKLPAGSSPSLWTVPGQTNAGGSQTYMARASLQITVSGGAVSFNEFSAEIVPYVAVEGSDGYDDRDLNNNNLPDDPIRFEPPIWYERDTNPASNGFGLGVYHRPMLHPSASFSESTSVYTDPLVCAWEEIDACGAAVRFSTGSIGELTVRIPKSLGGWFHGRLSEADLTMESYSNDLNRLVVSGKSVDVPVTSAYFPLFAQNGAATTSYQRYWQDEIATGDDEDNNPNTSYLESYRLAEQVNRGGMATSSWWAPNATGSLDDFIRYFPTLDERAKGLNNAWRFATLPAQGTDHACFADKSRIQGLITTNAMVYQAGLPILEGGKFKYQVAGVHKNYDGSVFSGKYDLVMRADDARCLYGLPLVVPDAKVSVKDSLGNSKSFQSSVTLDGEWLEIYASDFTFSVPSIEVEFRELAAPTVGSSPTISTPTVKIPTVAKGKSRTSKVILADAGIKLTKGQKATISINKASKKFCSVSGSKVKAKKKGTCSYTVTVKNKKGKKVSTKAGSFTVS